MSPVIGHVSRPRPDRYTVTVPCDGNVIRCCSEAPALLTDDKGRRLGCYLLNDAGSDHGSLKAVASQQCTRTGQKLYGSSN